MIPDTAPSEVLAGARRGAGDPERRVDAFWAALVGSVDALLRSYYGICEFTDEPDCVLRIGRSAARAAISLSDGTEIRPGDPIGTLHFWNEHLPRYESGGPQLNWAADMHRRMLGSLRALADFVETDPDWREVRAFRGEMSSRLGVLQLGRVAQRYGFERVPAAASLVRQLHTLGECVVAWGLARAFNPAALSRQQFFRAYHELWISRPVLIERYGRPLRAGRRGRGAA